jgi:hypothetical protein
MNESIMKSLGFEKEVELKKNGFCPICGEKVHPESFRDDCSRREFKISGMCQKCQDAFFSPN